MENGSPSMATQNSGDIPSGNVQQHFSVPTTGGQAVSIVAQDPSKGVYIVDPSQQHAALQMFGDQQRLIAAASSNQVELTSNSTTASAQTIVVRLLFVRLLIRYLRLEKLGKSPIGLLFTPFRH